MRTWMKSGYAGVYHLTEESQQDGYAYRTLCGRDWKRAQPAAEQPPTEVLRCSQCEHTFSVESREHALAELASHALPEDMPGAWIRQRIRQSSEPEPIKLSAEDIRFMERMASEFLARGEARFGSAANFQTAMARFNELGSVPF